MARLARLTLGHHLHHLLHRAAEGASIGADAVDRAAYRQALLDVARELRVAVHAYAVLPDRVQLLLTPPSGPAVSTLMQRVGRRHVGHLNQRYGRTGSPFAGRFRVALLQPERHLLEAMQMIDAAASSDGLVDRPEDWDASSAAAHLGRRSDPLLTDHSAHWALGNTPFEREIAYRRRLDEPLAAASREALMRATESGWVLGDEAFVATLPTDQARPLLPRPRGRPRRSPTVTDQSDPN